jgi:uncharacterized protein (DUF697 family)
MSDVALDDRHIPPTGEEASPDDQVAKLREAARQMGAGSLRDGSWFRKIVVSHVKKHAAQVHPADWDRLYPELDVEQRAHAQIKRASAKTVVTAVAAATMSSAGELASLFSEGLASPVAIPATVLAMVIEAAYTSLLQIDLACDLASIYGVPFDPDDVGEVATLFGVALDVDLKKKKAGDDGIADAEQPQGLMAKLMELEDGELAKRIGRKMLEDAVIKNVVPVIGIAIAARWNYVGTRRLAAAVRKYVRYRRALFQTMARLDLSRVTDPGVLVEGAWLLATVDGDAAHEEVMAVALILDRLTPEARRALSLDQRLGEDEEAWFESLAHLPPEMHDPLLDVLSLLAATDRTLCPSERRFLRRVAKALGRTVDLERVDRICRHLACGEELPSGMLRSMSDGASARTTS